MSEAINILLVDDEPRNLDALEAILDDPGYRLLRADSADRALHLLLENDVAAIVLDIKMPVVSGFELATMIKGTKKFRQIPIVFLTAHLLDDQDILTGYGTGAVDYLTKPVNPQILRHKIATFADLFRKTRALAELNEHLERRVRERTQELEKSESALRSANKQKDLFLATLAHELRNPLAPLRTGLDILLHQPEQSTTSTRVIAAMNRQLSHMVRLIDDLLDVSRISRGKLEMRMERIDLGTVVERAIETVQPALSRRNQRVEVEHEGPLLATVDPTRIAQVIGNLLSNASKHSPEGAPIRVSVRAAADTAVIQVIDQGVGIPHEQLDRVFDMFTKIERPTGVTNDGLGIGLALARQLIELHRGTLSVASAGEGQGATFSLSLPTGSAPPEAARQLAPAAVASSSSEGAALASGAAGATVQLQSAPLEPEPPRNSAGRGNAGLRVVVVEDNDDAADMMCTWVERLGHAVQVARSGPEGLDVIMNSRPDVVLCDVGLPGMDGVELCRRVLDGLAAPPLMIALTGWGMEADRRRTAEAGFRHHLVKPVAMDQLRDVLKSVPLPTTAASAERPERERST